MRGLNLYIKTILKNTNPTIAPMNYSKQVMIMPTDTQHTYLVCHTCVSSNFGTPARETRCISHQRARLHANMEIQNKDVGKWLAFVQVYAYSVDKWTHPFV